MGVKERRSKLNGKNQNGYHTYQASQKRRLLCAEYGACVLHGMANENLEG